MKLRDRGLIIAGLAVFLIVATFPFWYGRGKAVAPPDLELDTPVINKLAERKCLESTPYMRANHMKLLVDWRNSVVRKGNRVYTATNGKTFEMNLTGTCFHCHSNQKHFCDRCHTYVGAKPDCWSCHIIPEDIPK